MDTPRLVALILPFVWVAWAAATTVLAVRGYRRDLGGDPPRRKVLWIAAATALAAWGTTFLIPARIDSSGLLELAGGGEPWKGAAGEAVIAIAGAVVALDLEAIIHFTRASVVPACMLAVLVIAEPGADGEKWIRRGIDLRALLAVGTLLVTPSFLFGTLGVFNFWFFCTVSLAMLLAWRDVVGEPTNAGRIALVTSVLLIGFARPETIAGGIVLAVAATVFASRRRDIRLAIPAALALLLLIAVAPAVSAYLADRMRNQPLLTGADATGSAPLWQLPWIATRRIVEHAPVNLLVLLIALHSIGVLAVVRAVRIVRSRRASWIELAALAFVMVEFLAIGVHREGFTRYIKYGQLLAVPCWYLATRVWFAQPAGRSTRRLLGGAFAAGATAMVASLALTGPGFNRCSLPEGRTLSARRADELLLWNTTPGWVRSVCGGSGTQPARVVVVGLDERVPRAEGAIEDGFSTPMCEPERWPVGRLLSRGGCETLSVYPDRREPIRKTLFDSETGALCRPVVSGGGGREPQRATHAIVTYYRHERADEVREAVAAHPACGWEILETTPSAMLLRSR